ncbi:protein of unknown function [Polynucleobacter meluiroseus]|uniref:3-keto-alpha-glucoside-1,2-lyase/3-keto-2-hydroxy-glucal hydratase domain-containing protein n=1 Tax=Polynucleobacter meluiroseus TaxID=1938814 RepID=A0A240E382_9BURK|nr:DUF1080 domain-containing protein [Polynucleobacter meluiroseus]SNX29384.1 protein of unknown function [Polynucleobacter meluiroseus]
MQRFIKLCTALAFSSAFTLSGNSALAQKSDGFIDLMNGGSLSGWNVIGNANWIISKDMIESNKPSGYLVSTQSYRNLVIRAEFWVESTSNSGIFIRCQNPQKLSQQSCYEINIWDTRPEQAYATGAIVDVAKVDPVPLAGGRWNTMEIIANGPHFKVTLNGVVTVADGQDSKYSEGPIGIQSAAGIVKFRKLEIKPL